MLEGVQRKVDEIQRGYVLWTRITFGVLAMLVLVVLLGAVAAVVAIHENHNRIEDIQASRIDVALTTCRDQNARRTNTINQLDDIIAKRSKGAPPAERARMRTSRAFTILLIDALAPHQDCNKVIHERYGRKDGKGHA